MTQNVQSVRFVRFVRFVQLVPFALAGAALAHDLPHPKKDALRLTPEGLSVVVDYEVNPGEAASGLRALFDRDGDGRLSPPEQAQLTEYLARTATLFFKTTSDGAPLSFERRRATAERVDEPANSTALLAVTVELFAPWPGAWPRGWFGFGRARHVVIDDKPKQRGDHVPVTVTVDRVTLSGASQGVLDRAVLRGALLGEAPLELDVGLAR